MAFTNDSLSQDMQVLMFCYADVRSRWILLDKDALP